MALNQSILPAPLHLNLRNRTFLSNAQACSSLELFLSTDAAQLLAGGGAVRASLARLVQGLKDELDAGVAVSQPKDEPAVARPQAVEEGDKKKKRRKSDKGTDGEGKKRRKVEA
ncbi:hypothetical protein JCM1841_000952 [Sporobolomyces salmonicolor]